MSNLSSEILAEVNNICRKIESNEELSDDNLTTLLIATILDEEGSHESGK